MGLAFEDSNVHSPRLPLLGPNNFLTPSVMSRTRGYCTALGLGVIM